MILKNAKAVDQLHILKNIAMGIGGLGVFGIVASMNALPYMLRRKIRESEHYREAVRLLHSHPEAIKYLGEPIEELPIRVTSRENYGNDEDLFFVRVPVKGSKTTGYLYYDCDKNDHKLNLSNVQLTLTNLPDYKLLIKKKE